MTYKTAYYIDGMDVVELLIILENGMRIKETTKTMVNKDGSQFQEIERVDEFGTKYLTKKKTSIFGDQYIEEF